MSIIYTTRAVAKSIAEDAVKDRFAKPVNFGQWNPETEKYLLEKTLESGFYAIKFFNTPDDSYATALIFIENGKGSLSTVVWDWATDLQIAFSVSTDGSVSCVGSGVLLENTTIEFYKLD